MTLKSTIQTKNNRVKWKRILFLLLLIGSSLLVLFLSSTRPSISLMSKERWKTYLSHKQRLTESKISTVLPPNNSDEKVIYLTFDDGPSSATGNILAILQKYSAHATFFMLTPNMKGHQKQVKKIVEQGHGVGLHGSTHDKNQFYESEQSAVNEMNEARSALQSIAGMDSTYIRTPYGSIPYLMDSYREALEKQGYILWDWDIDSNDWNLTEGEFVKNTLNQIDSLAKHASQLVVLLHDQEETAKHLPELLNALTNKGFQLKKLDDSVEPVQFQCYDRCQIIGK